MSSQELFDGKYKVLKVLGQGGMGTVYLAENVRLGTLWAIKEVVKSSDVDFLAEPNILKRLNHPALPRIVDIIEAEERIFIIEDFIEGKGLDRELDDNGSFPESRVIEWAKQLCDVLGYLHNQKPNPIIYRDLKPGNLILSADGNLKLIDFGIAREYKQEAVSDTTYIGTRGYAAPEQYGTAQTDARTDIYSLGVTLYHVLTGKSPNEPPYEIKPVREFNTEFSQGIEYILLKCTEQDPGKRYQSVDELLVDLENIHKFDQAYKRQLLTKNIKLAVVGAAFVAFGYLSFAGYLQLGKEKVDFYNSLLQKGKQLVNQRNYDQAISAFKEANVAIPTKKEAYTEIARVLLKRQEYDKSINYIDQEVLEKVQAAQNDSDLYYIRGTAYFEKKDYLNAAISFDKAKSLSPGNATYYRDLIVSYARANKLEEADAVDKEAQNKGMDEDVVLFVRGEISGARKDYPSAVKSFEECIAKAQDEELKRRAFVSIAEIYRDHPDTFNGAVDLQVNILERANSELKDKNNAIISEMLGQAYFNKAMTFKKDSNEFKVYMNKSLAQFDLLLNMGLDIPYIYRNKGIIYHYTGDFRQSEEIFQAMKEHFPDDYRGYMELALLYADMENQNPKEKRNYQRVKEYADLAIQNSPNGEKNPELMPLMNLLAQLKAKGWLK